MKKLAPFLSSQLILPALIGVAAIFCLLSLTADKWTSATNVDVFGFSFSDPPLQTECSHCGYLANWDEGENKTYTCIRCGLVQQFSRKPNIDKARKSLDEPIP
jgi:hypothetical protein